MSGYTLDIVVLAVVANAAVLRWAAFRHMGRCRWCGGAGWLERRVGHGGLLRTVCPRCNGGGTL